MPIKKILLILIPVYIFFNLNLNGNYFTYKWACFEIFTIAALSYCIFRSYNIFIAGLFFYLGSENIIRGIQIKDPLYLLALNKGTVTLILSASILIFGKKIISKIPNELFLFLLLAHIAQIFIGFPYQGFTGNTSLNASLISFLFFLSIPTANKLYAGTYYLFIVSLITAFCTGASIGVFALIAGATAYCFLSEKSQLKFLSILIPLILIPITFFIYKGNTFSLSGRPDIWNSIWLYIKNEGSLFFGNGAGSGFYLIQKAILKYSETHKELTPWGHCEPLQLILEGGLIGLVLAVLSVVSYIKTSIQKKTHYLTAFAICYLANCAGNFPHRLAPDAFLILIAIALNYKDENDSTYPR